MTKSEELAAQNQALSTDAAERRRLEGAKNQATAAYQQARDSHNRLLNDVDANIDATDDDRAKAAKSHKNARGAMAKAVAALAAHETATGDLTERAQKLGARGHDLAKDRARLAHRAIVEKKLRVALQLEALEAEEHRIVAEAPAGTNLVPCTFVRGIFRPVVTGLGPDCPKAIFRDDVIRSIAAIYPDLVTEALPADEAGGIFAAIERDCQKGIIRFAATAVDWQPAGGWHQGRITADEMKSYLSGRLRREHHDL